MTDLLSTYNLNNASRELGSFVLTSLHLQREHAYLSGRALKGEVCLATLPERARVVTVIDRGDHMGEVVAELDGVLALVRWWKAGGYACTSASSSEAAKAVLDEIVARVPVVDEPLKVAVSFTDANAGSRNASLDIRPWADIRDHYSPTVAEAMDELLAYRPEQSASRRLLLWHGAPGTGKTSAIRALLHGWREWADGVVVTDPEVLLSQGPYLRDTVLDVDDEDRWQVIVLEDAEDLLHKARGGAALGKLLNLCDGLLGQGLRCLFLITTNEPLQAVHPALVRPGRCLANVEFGPLPASQAARLLGRPVDRDLTLAEVMTAKPLQVVQEQVAVGQYL